MLSNFSPSGDFTALPWALLALSFSLLYIFISRLILSPISHIPGPFLARLSFWPEFYHDVVKRGQYFREIDRLHSQYGPPPIPSPKNKLMIMTGQDQLYE